MSATGLVWTGGDQVEVREVPAATGSAGSVLVEVAYTGLCGTDLHICAGEHPRAQPGLVIGHEIVGVVRGEHAEAAGLADGTPVVVNPLISCGTCRMCRVGRPHNCATLKLIGIDSAGGASEQVAVPIANLVPVAIGTDLFKLAFAEPLAVAVRAVRRSGLGLGDRVLIFGAGPIGLALALTARLAGAGSVQLIELSPTRRELAESLGFTTAASLADHLGARQQLAEVTFDAAAHPAVAASLAAATIEGGRVVLAGVYGEPTALDLQQCTFKELTLIGTRVYSADDLQTATQLIVNGTFDPTPLLTKTVRLADAADAIAELRSGTQVKVLIEGPAATPPGGQPELRDGLVEEPVRGTADLVEPLGGPPPLGRFPSQAGI